MSGIAGIILSALPTSGWEPLPPWVFWVVAFICFFIAAFRVWQGAYRAGIAGAPALAFVDVDCNTLPNHWGVRVKNVSPGKTIKSCRVVLASIEPRPETVREVAVALHCSGHEMPTQYVDFNPGAEEVFDVVVILKAREWQLAYYLWDARVTIPPNDYRITLRAEGEDAPHATRVFMVKSTPTGLDFYSADGELKAKPAVAA